MHGRKQQISIYVTMFSRACFPSSQTRYNSAAWLLMLHNVSIAGWLAGWLAQLSFTLKQDSSFHQPISWNVLLQPFYFEVHLSKLKPLMTTALYGYGETKECLYQS
jgi:hypothetical protein